MKISYLASVLIVVASSVRWLREAAALTLGSMASPLQLKAGSLNELKPAFPGSADAWFAKIKGKHRIVYILSILPSCY